MAVLAYVNIFSKRFKYVVHDFGTFKYIGNEGEEISFES
jgi:hypothetical protein